MHQLYAQKLYTIASYLEKLTTTEGNGLISQEKRSAILTKLKGIYKSLELMNLQVSAVYLKRMTAKLSSDSCTLKQLKAMLPELQSRIKDELSSVLLMYIPSSKAEYFQKQALFGEQVTNKFPSAIIDIEEAGKCFATGRNTAAVMHLMRVIEVGLNAVADELNISLKNPNWGSILSAINKEIEKRHAEGQKEWTKIEPFYKELAAHLHAIKNAWRNPTMHAEKKYDEQQTEDIFNAVRGLMRYLATQLSESSN